MGCPPAGYEQRWDPKISRRRLERPPVSCPSCFRIPPWTVRIPHSKAGDECQSPAGQLSSACLQRSSDLVRLLVELLHAHSGEGKSVGVHADGCGALRSRLSLFLFCGILDTAQGSEKIQAVLHRPLRTAQALSISTSIDISLFSPMFFFSSLVLFFPSFSLSTRRPGM